MYAVAYHMLAKSVPVFTKGVCRYEKKQDREWLGWCRTNK
jgi:hypothetical protein